MNPKSRGMLGGVLVFGSLAAFFALHYGPDLVRDIGVRSQALVPQPLLRVTEADCLRYYGIASSCSIGHTEVRVPQEHMVLKDNRGVLRYFVFGSLAGERITLMRPAGRPDIVTTDVGMRHLSGRIFALATLIGLTLIIAIAFAFRMLVPLNRDAEWSNSARIDEAIAAGASGHGLTTPNPASPPKGMAPRASTVAFGRRSLAP